MTVKERLKTFVNSQDITISAFEKEINSSNGYVNSISKSIGLDKISKIKEKYPKLNLEWLLTGDGEMLKEEKKYEAIPLTAGIVKFIPLVSQYAQAGYLSGFSDETYMETLPTIPVILTQEAKGDYVCFEVSGDSMISDTNPEESIFEGDLLVCRNVDKEYWKSKLHINKWDFVIVHEEEGVIVKRITDHIVDEGKITIHSLNSMYDDRTLSLKEVDKLFNVVKIMRDRKR